VGNRRNEVDDCVSVVQNWKPWPDLDSPEWPQYGAKEPSAAIPSHAASKHTLTSTLPNPFRDLSPTAQNLVKHISEMGFALPRVARACQLLGEDDKKVSPTRGHFMVK
jgi:hypothetical protein